MNVQVEREGGDNALPFKGGAPGHRTRVLVVDHDPAAVAAIREILRSQSWEVISVETGRAALERARLEGPDAILAELELADMGAPDLCRALRGRSETASTPIIVLGSGAGVAERVASLRAGAFDYLVKPPDPQELIARLRAALDLRGEKAGLIVAVAGSKGGVGASTVAANLAVALRRETRLAVALVDAVLEGGEIDVLLNARVQHGQGQALLRLDDLESRDFESLLAPHASGLQALLLEALGLDLLHPDELRKILVTLRRMRDYVVVDTPPRRDENAAAILELADRVLLVLTPEITALRGAKLFLERAERAGLSRERIMPVLNRFPAAGGLQRKAIEETLGAPVQATVPDDVRLVTYSINRGVPVVQSHGSSGVARQIQALAKALVQSARAH